MQLAEREARDVEESLGLLEQCQALGESARLREHEGFSLGEHCGQERADLLGQGTRPTGQRQGHAVPAELGLDHREVVGHLGPDVDREVAPLQRLAVDRGGLGDPARILVHDRRLLLQRRRRLVAEQPSSPQEVALGRARGAQLLVHCRPDDEDLGQSLVESCCLGQPSGPVEQPPGALLGQLRADGAPGLRTKGDHLCFDVPRSTGLGRHCLGHRPGGGRVRDGGLVGRLGPRQQVGRAAHGRSRVHGHGT